MCANEVRDALLSLLLILAVYEVDIDGEIGIRIGEYWKFPRADNVFWA
jgi:hypothetical protein